MKKDREGKKENGKFYLRVGRTWVEVNSEVYYGYMDLVWAEEKRRTGDPAADSAGNAVMVIVNIVSMIRLERRSPWTRCTKKTITKRQTVGLQ